MLQDITNIHKKQYKLSNFNVQHVPKLDIHIANFCIKTLFNGNSKPLTTRRSTIQISINSPSFEKKVLKLTCRQNGV